MYPSSLLPDELAEAVAEQLLARWGVIFRDLMVREAFTVPWREVLWALRRMEARGTIRGGRFVNGFSALLFGSFLGTTAVSDFPSPCIIGVRPGTFRCGL